MITAARSQPWPRGRDRSQRFPLRAEFAWRALLAAGLVLLCYRFQWTFLRLATTESIFRLSNALGLDMQRVAWDTVQLNSTQIRFTIACTFADVWCGSIAFLWARHAAITQNLAKLAGYTAGLFLFNIFRLELGFVLYDHGVSWTWAHEAMGGLAYFLVWLWLWRRRSW